MLVKDYDKRERGEREGWTANIDCIEDFGGYEEGFIWFHLITFSSETVFFPKKLSFPFLY